jgi:hypothetical protein
MSKLLDRLDRISKGTVTQMGFGAAVRAEKTPPMVLVGRIGKAKAASTAAALSEAGFDGAVLDGVPADDSGKVADSLKGLPWGLKLEEVTTEQVAASREKGCDFLAFSSDKAFLEALSDNDKVDDEEGRILCISADMDERVLQVIDDLPVGAVLLSLDSVKPPLTMDHLLTIGSVRGCFNKYLLVELSGDLSSAELEGLRDIGVDGIVVVDAGSMSKTALKQCKERLQGLSRRQRKPQGRAGALLPMGGSHAEDHDDNDDDDDYEELRTGRTAGQHGGG